MGPFRPNFDQFIPLKYKLAISSWIGTLPLLIEKKNKVQL